MTKHAIDGLGLHVRDSRSRTMLCDDVLKAKHVGNVRPMMQVGPMMKMGHMRELGHLRQGFRRALNRLVRWGLGALDVLGSLVSGPAELAET